MRAVGLGQVEADLAVEADGLGDAGGELADAQVRAGADVDVALGRVVAEQEEAGAREVVRVQELPEGRPGAPERQLALAAELGVVHLADHRGKHVGLLEGEIVAGPVEVARHGADEVAAVLPAGEVAHADARDLGEGVALVGGLERAGEQGGLGDGLGRRLGVDAAGAEIAYTFTANDTITSTKMNNIIDQTTITSDAIIGNTLEVTSGKLRVRSANITSNELAANSVTTNAITDLNVTTGKIADLAITTAKIADSNVTTVKIADAVITAPKLNGAQTGTAPIFGVRAWGSFDGSATTPITPNGSGNIASIVRLAAASFRITFTTAMPNANYAVSFGSSVVVQTNNQAMATISLTARTTTTFDFNFQSTAFNSTLITFMVVG